MKKTMMKSVLAAAMLVGAVVGQCGVSVAAGVNAAAAKAPVMTDNLSKYGLKKAMNLPVTLEAEGLSYTLHKIMIYDFKSAEVKNLQKLYGFQNSTGIIGSPKYLIWTKITIQNNTKKTMHGGGGDIQKFVPLTFQDFKITDTIWPRALALKTNSTEALWTYTLKPGEKITSYLAYAYAGEFDYFVIRLYNGKTFVEKYVVQ